MSKDGQNDRNMQHVLIGLQIFLWLTAVSKPIFNLILSKGKNFTKKKKFRAHIRRNVAGSIPMGSVGLFIDYIIPAAL